MDYDRNCVGPFMTFVGFALFMADSSQKECLIVLMHCFAMACILSVVWLVAGYSLALTSGNDWVGSLSGLWKGVKW